MSYGYRGPLYQPPTHERMVDHPHDACQQQGCQLQAAQQVLTQAQAALAEAKEKWMSSALWCDQGGHAFSAQDRGKMRATVTVTDEETGEDRVETRDICGACAGASGLARKIQTRPQPSSVPALPPAQQAHVADMERELGISDAAPARSPDSL